MAVSELCWNFWCTEIWLTVFCVLKILWSLGIAEGLCFGRQDADSTWLQFKDISLTRLPFSKFLWHSWCSALANNAACGACKCYGTLNWKYYFELKITTQKLRAGHICIFLHRVELKCQDRGAWAELAQHLHTLLCSFSWIPNVSVRDQIAEAYIPALSAKRHLRTSSFELCRYN